MYSVVLCGLHQLSNGLSVLGSDWHDVAAWGGKKTRGVIIRMERGRHVPVSVGDDVDEFIELPRFRICTSPQTCSVPGSPPSGCKD